MTNGPEPGVGDAAGVELHWLGGRVLPVLPGAACGVPWPKGAVRATQSFRMTADGIGEVPVQTWPLAFWPDGSVKWTAAAVGPEAAAPRLVLSPGAPRPPVRPVSVTESAAAVTVDTGVVRCVFPRRGDVILESVDRAGLRLLGPARLVCLRQDRPDGASEGSYAVEQYGSEVAEAAAEQEGPVRAVVRIGGVHRGPGGRALLPFVLRFHLTGGSEAVRIVHTFVFDGDPRKDFLRGLGLRFEVPLRDPPHDRHVRFVGQDGGLWAEAVRDLTGLRMDPGSAYRRAQCAGAATPPLEDLPERFLSRLPYVPAWNDYELSQLSADGFEIRKRTAGDRAWIRADGGNRAAGVGYVGGPHGGAGFAMRDFWRKHPAEIHIHGAASDAAPAAAEVSLWFYAPKAPAMDLRPYHDGMGMRTHEEQIRGLDITYEDWEEGYDVSTGIARTGEVTLWPVPATPSRDLMILWARCSDAPPLPVCDPSRYAGAGVFGGSFGPVDRTTPVRARLEDRLDFLLGHYMRQVEERRWYGFWDYGDVMHAYDADRHVWRYDVGGYAWDNSELSTDLWLWYGFLRTGRADVFRFAEAMTRHTGEVDVYHLGRFRGLGTRHGVQHWSCSAKQLRISSAVYRRIYYYLTADGRTGDLMRELVDAERTFLTVDPLRKVRRTAYTSSPGALEIGLGTDWGSLAAAWLTEWERTGDERCRRKLMDSMESIGALPRGFFSRALYDLATGRFRDDGGKRPVVSHLSAMFGLPEICAELLDLLEVPAFEKAWMAYCTLYGASAAEQEAVLGSPLTGNSWLDTHSRLTAYAARRTHDAVLAGRAWREFFGGATESDRDWCRIRHVDVPEVLHPVEEAPGLSTNYAAQWSLAAMQNLALIGEWIPKA